MYSSTFSLTSILDRDGWSTSRLGRFSLDKETRYPLYRKLGVPQRRSVRVRKISPTPGFDPRNVCSVSLYRCAIRAHLTCYNTCKGKGKAVPLQSWRGPKGSRKLSFPDFVTKAQDSGKVVSLTHRPPLLPGSSPGTHFC